MVVLRVGILGCANISSKAVRAIALADGGAVRVVAVASRDPAKGRAFLAQCNLAADAVRVTTYQELADASDVDALYVPLPTTLHAEWVARAAARGKHVLCEKPLAVTREEARAMLAACRAAGVLFMDGTMFMHHDRTRRLADALAQGQIGDVRKVTASFCFNGGEDFLRNNIRVKGDADRLGALGDLGWYCAKGALVAFGFERPVRVCASIGGVANDAAVTLAGAATIEWPRRRVAHIEYSFLDAFRQVLEITGGEGYLTLHDFVLPDEETSACYEHVSGPTMVVEPNKPTQCYRPLATVTVPNAKPQETQMWETFAALAAEPGSAEAQRWMEQALLTQEVVSAVHESQLAGCQPVEL